MACRVGRRASLVGGGGLGGLGGGGVPVEGSGGSGRDGGGRGTEDAETEAPMPETMLDMAASTRTRACIRGMKVAAVQAEVGGGPPGGGAPCPYCLQCRLAPGLHEHCATPPPPRPLGAESGHPRQNRTLAPPIHYAEGLMRGFGFRAGPATCTNTLGHRVGASTSTLTLRFSLKLR